MGCKRNKIIEISQYLTSIGIEVNIGKNKARGHKGFFRTKNNNYRIDIAKNLSEEAILRTLSHEFAHYIHYCKDNTLQSLDFIFPTLDDYIEELISVTVDSIPKSTVTPLFDIKKRLETEVQNLTEQLSLIAANADSDIFFSNLSSKKLINEITKAELCAKISSKQKSIKRVNQKISRLNRYYNLPSELFARAVELYTTNNSRFQQLAPKIFDKFESAIKTNKIPCFSKFCKLFLQKNS